ncbi:dihydrolipoyl dehydrogenase family protein [Luteimicrobium subarcticum]|uniref:Dihydrolipoamide dehydrogenase n=1 Tax=Luteimicrobium subarcticum TaxID=620910 RepID=A0A2M8WVQ7_9MICO|nr:NAD(P)/FAD-dependent oxidoreductase [Luteimicrobium subarcticum]PJI95008.1 dihydrolipoamide dehydrogenase [Luteimicrobium subarcticum]
MTADTGSDRTPDLTYDVVVIGGGPVGENVADRAGRTGLTVAIVESELVGGECSYWACMPSKALLRPGAALAAARDVAGVSASADLDAAAVLATRDTFTSDWDDAGQVQWLDGAGIALLRGHGRLVGPKLVEVSPSAASDTFDAPAHLVQARHAVVVATGSVPVLPDVPGLLDAGPWGSREATSAQQVPESLVVLGGGVVACEMATAYADLGASVTLLARSGLLRPFEAFAGEQVGAGLREGGVDVRLGASPTRVTRHDDGSVTVAFTDPQGEHEVTASEVLAATGRVPRTDDVGLDAVGLTDLRRGLPVGDDLLVDGVEGGWLFATGDVTGRVATTHQGKYQGRVAGDVIAARFGSPDASGDSVPAPATPDGRAAADAVAPWSRFAASADHTAQTQVVFTRPQVASVGLTEQAAHDAGLDVRTVSFGLGDVAGGSLMGTHYAGTAQLVVDEARRVVVGATFVGPEAGEMLHAATIAVVGEVPLDRLWHAVPAYPTVSEVWLRLLETYGL